MLLGVDGKEISEKVGIYSRVLLPGLAALVAALAPAAVGAVFKWSEDHSRLRQRVALSDRMAALAKLIAEMPELPIDVVPSVAGTSSTPRSVLTAELLSVSRDLAALQAARAGRHVVSTLADRVRAALLLYAPHGPLAWMLHLVFYAYLATFTLVMAVVLSHPKDPDSWYAILGFGVIGIPPLVMRHFASKLHRKYCASVAASGTGAAHTLGASQAPADARAMQSV